MSHDLSSIDLDRLDAHLQRAPAHATTLRQARSIASMRHEQAGAGSEREPAADALRGCAELLAAWDTNDRAWRVVLNELRRSRITGNAPSRVRIDAALERRGLTAAPDLVTVDPLELVGFAPTSGFVDDPVCAANGNFIHVDHDLVTLGFGAVLTLTRVWNSRAWDRAGLFGTGWSTLFDMRIDRPHAGVLRLTGADGRRVPLVKRADVDQRRPLQGAVWCSLRGDDVQVVADGDGWRARHGSQEWRFGASGQLVSGRDGAAHWTIERGSETLTASEILSGRWLRLTVGADGLVTDAQTSDGRRAAYRYVGGCLVRVDRPEGALTFEMEDAKVAAIVDADGVRLCENTYDADGTTRSQRTPFGRVARYEYLDDGATRVSDDAGGPVNLFRHDDAGNLVALHGGTGSALRARWDSRSRLTWLEDRTGSSTRWARHTDESGTERTTRTTAGDTVTVDRDRQRRPRRVERVSNDDLAGSDAVPDCAGWGLEYADPSAVAPSTLVDPLGGRVTLDRDDRDLPVRIVDQDGVRVDVEWDRDGLVVAMSSPTQVLRVERNRHGRVTRVDRLRPQDRSTPSPDADGAVSTTIRRDPAGRVIEVHGPMGGARWERTPAGRVSAQYGLNGAHEWTAERGVHGEIERIRFARGGEEQFEWNAEGLLCAATDALGHRHIREYDSEGRLVAIVSPRGHRTVWEWDRGGRVVSVTDAEGRSTRRTVDAQGRTTTLQRADGGALAIAHGLHGWTSVADETGRRWTQHYDAMGRVVARTGPAGTTRWTWTAAGRPATCVTPAGRTYTWVWSPHGRLHEVTDPDGQVIHPATADRLVPSATDPLATMPNHRVGSGRVTPQRAGSIVTTDRADVEATWDFDSRGDLVAVSCGAWSREINRDADGRPTSMVEPQGTISTIDTDATGEVTAVAFGNASSDRAGDPPGLDGWRVARDARRRIRSVSDVNGRPLIEVSRTHDARGRTKLTVGTPAGPTVAIVDAAGQLCSVTGIHGATLTIDRDADGAVQSMADSDGHLVTADRSPGGHLRGWRVGDTFEIAAADSPRDRRQHRLDGRISIDENGQTHRYDPAGRLVESVTADGEQWTFGYDAQGRLAEETHPERGAITYVWNESNQLVSLVEVSPHARRTRRFTYDHRGRRISDVCSSGQTIGYRWNTLDQLTAVVLDAPTTGGRARRETVIEWSGFGRPERVDGVPVLWDDALTGKPIRIGNRRWLRSGTQVCPVPQPGSEITPAWSTMTGGDPWGADPEREPGSEPTVGWRGELSIGCLLVLGARVYDPTTRSFLSRDPLPPVPDRPASLCEYAYAWNDPVNFVDPSGARPIGLEEFEDWRRAQETGALGAFGAALVENADWVALGLVAGAGVALLFVPGGQVVGAGILLGITMESSVALVTGEFDPAQVALAGTLGGLTAGVGAAGQPLRTTAAMLGAVAATGDVAEQTLVTDTPLDDLNWVDVAIAGFAGAVGARSMGMGSSTVVGTTEEVASQLAVDGDGLLGASLSTRELNPEAMVLAAATSAVGVITDEHLDTLTDRGAAAGSGPARSGAPPAPGATIAHPTPPAFSPAALLETVAPIVAPLLLPAVIPGDRGAGHDGSSGGSSSPPADRAVDIARRSGDPGGRGTREARTPFGVVGDTDTDRGRNAIIRMLTDTGLHVTEVDGPEQIEQDEYQVIVHDPQTVSIVLPGVIDASSPDLGYDGHHRSVRDLDQQAVHSFGSCSIQDNGYAQMVAEDIGRLIEDGLVEPGASASIVGHSFGADTAVDLAADAHVNGHLLDVTHVVAAGYHVEPQLDCLPPDVTTTVIQNRNDGVVAIEAIGDAIGAVTAVGVDLDRAVGAASDAAPPIIDGGIAAFNATVGSATGITIPSPDRATAIDRYSERITIHEFDGGTTGFGHAQENYIDYVETAPGAFDEFLADFAAMGYAEPGTALAIDVSVED